MRTVFLLAAGFLFLVTGAIQAAHLVLEGGGLWGQADRYINDSETEIPWSPVADSGQEYASAQKDGETEYSYAYGEMHGEVAESYHWAKDGILVAVNGTAECQSSDGGAAVEAYGTGGTLVPAQTDGIFFRVEPDAGETVGTRVRIHWHWYGEAYDVQGNALASIGSNGIYLTRNVTPPTGMPDTGIMWSHEGITFTGYDWYEEEGTFVAEIGDLIGVFMSCDTSAQISGSDYAYASVTSSMDLRTGEALGELWELPYAPGLVYDPVQNITFLEDWSACGAPMNWYDAAQWAQDFEFTSGDVTYTDWRLPVTTDEQGVAAGELGFLAISCGISDTYFGPFTNTTDGDYWTAPQFLRNPDPAVAYVFTFNPTYGPAQWDSLLSHECYVIPVFDGMPQDRWCPADFNNNGIVDFTDFAVFASWWLHERPGLPM